jgi:hypothetical protein
MKFFVVGGAEAQKTSAQVDKAGAGRKVRAHPTPSPPRAHDRFMAVAAARRVPGPTDP